HRDAGRLLVVDRVSDAQLDAGLGLHRGDHLVVDDRLGHPRFPLLAHLPARHFLPPDGLALHARLCGTPASMTAFSRSATVQRPSVVSFQSGSSSHGRTRCTRLPPTRNTSPEISHAGLDRKVTNGATLPGCQRSNSPSLGAMTSPNVLSVRRVRARGRIALTSTR